MKAAARRAEPQAVTVIDAPVTVTRYGTADAPFVAMMIGGGHAADERTAALRRVQASNGIKDLALAESLAQCVDTARATATFAKGHYWFSYTADLPNR